MAYAAIRIKGTVNVREDMDDTLKILRLTRANHCVVVPENESYKGMLQKVKDYITWGEISPETMARLLYLRGKLVGGHPISEAFVRENTDYDGIEELAKAIVSDEISMNKIDGLKPVFRLHPPIGGFKKIKRAYSDGGCLGYRGKDINALLDRMMEDRGHEDGEEKE